MVKISKREAALIRKAGFPNLIAKTKHYRYVEVENGILKFISEFRAGKKPTGVRV